MASRAQMVREEYPEPKNEASSSGVSWAAVFAGAFVIGAVSLILTVLGTGIGLSSVSIWPNAGETAARISVGAIIWLILVQIVASALGGYLAGRLRTKWVGLHTHEVYFRDTANGFLAWAVALAMSSLLFVGLYAVSVAAIDRANAPATGPGAYFVDMLFRTDQPTPATTAGAAANDPAVRAEAAAVLANAVRQPDMSTQDQMYLANLIAASTGLPLDQAQQRVMDTVAADRQELEAARRAIAHSMYWLFVGLLIGAICASFAATLGGDRRDHVPVPV